MWEQGLNANMLSLLHEHTHTHAWTHQVKSRQVVWPHSSCSAEADSQLKVNHQHKCCLMKTLTPFASICTGDTHKPPFTSDTDARLKACLDQQLISLSHTHTPRAVMPLSSLCSQGMFWEYSFSCMKLLWQTFLLCLSQSTDELTYLVIMSMTETHLQFAQNVTVLFLS